MFKSICWQCACTLLGSSTPCHYHMGEISRTPRGKTVASSANRISGQTLVSDIFKQCWRSTTSGQWLEMTDWNRNVLKASLILLLDDWGHDAWVAHHCHMHPPFLSFSDASKDNILSIEEWKDVLSEEKARCVNKMRPFGEVKALLESQSFNRMSWDHEDLKDTWVFFEVRACGMLKDPRTGIWFFFCSIFSEAQLCAWHR